MDEKEYAKAALSTEATDFFGMTGRLVHGDGRTLRLLHSVMGMSDEVGELAQALLLPSLDHVNLLEELGDLCWFLNLGVQAVVQKASSPFTLEGLREVYRVTEDAEDVEVMLERPTSVCAGADYRHILERGHLVLTKQVGGAVAALKSYIFYNRNNATAMTDLVVSFGGIYNTIRAICDENNLPIGEVFQSNIDKLEARFPNKFEEYRAQNRDLDAERKALEKGAQK